MLALPIALPVTLAGQISLESAKMKREVDAALPAKFRSSMVGMKLNLWGTFEFGKDGYLCKFSLSPERVSSRSFSVNFDNETFSQAASSIEDQVVFKWLDIATERRMGWGRELAHLSDDDLEDREFSVLVSDYVTTRGHVELQEAFLFRLRKAELELRQISSSNHDKIQAIQEAKPLRELLDNERVRAEKWADTASEGELNLTHYDAGKIPEAVHPIYAYRRYHMDRHEGFPLFNLWGEPVSRGGKVNGASKPATPGA